jgi:hypothetical protein
VRIVIIFLFVALSFMFFALILVVFLATLVK